MSKAEREKRQAKFEKIKLEFMGVGVREPHEHREYLIRSPSGKIYGIDKELADLNGVHDLGPKIGLFYTVRFNEKKLLDFAKLELAAYLIDEMKNG